MKRKNAQMYKPSVLEERAPLWREVPIRLEPSRPAAKQVFNTLPSGDRSQLDDASERKPEFWWEERTDELALQDARVGPCERPARIEISRLQLKPS